MCCDVLLGVVGLFQAGSISCLVLSESPPLVQATNPNLASLVIIINVLFTPSSRSLMKMLNETRMKPRPRGIPLDTFQRLDTLPCAVSLPFVYLASTGPCFFERGRKLSIAIAAVRPLKGGNIKIWRIVNMSF